MRVKKFNLVVKHKISSFSKSIFVDSDKSLSIRSFLIGSICQGTSIANNVLESEDVKSAISVCRILGIKIKKVKHKTYKMGKHRSLAVVAGAYLDLGDFKKAEKF